MDPRRPSLVTLDVADLERSLAFFHETLGIPVKLRTEGYAELQTEGLSLALRQTRRTPDRPSGSPAVGWEVEDLDAAARHLAARGVRVDEVAGGDEAAWTSSVLCLLQGQAQ